MKLSKEYNLGVLYPNLVKEWDEENDKTPYEVTPGSNFKAKWVCPKGHKYSSFVTVNGYDPKRTSVSG